jgi:hypothetical protein
MHFKRSDFVPLARHLPNHVHLHLVPNLAVTHNCADAADRNAPRVVVHDTAVVVAAAADGDRDVAVAAWMAEDKSSWLDSAVQTQRRPETLNN